MDGDRSAGLDRRDGREDRVRGMGWDGMAARVLGFRDEDGNGSRGKRCDISVFRNEVFLDRTPGGCC